MGQYEGSMPSQFLHNVFGRRNRSFALTGVVLLLLATITWMYGGFAGSALAVPPDQFSPGKNVDLNPKPVDHHTDMGGDGEEEDTDESANWPKPSEESNQDHNPWPTHAASSTATHGSPANSSTPTPAPSSAAAAAPTSGVAAGGIPPKIWQILLPKKIKKPEDAKILTDPKVLQDTPSWLVLNPDHK